ncbi:hypothetical protein BDR26DRAFT_894833 [Obelidium mucronatum]|nr:hypothetical protein BDR26DRAFT_894833 [Obelidium mucronatum]
MNTDMDIQKAHHWLSQNHGNDPHWCLVEKEVRSLCPGSTFGAFSLTPENLFTLTGDFMIYNVLIDEIFSRWNAAALESGDCRVLWGSTNHFVHLCRQPGADHTLFPTVQLFNAYKSVFTRNGASSVKEVC